MDELKQIGIVGSGSDKFTPISEECAKDEIGKIIVQFTKDVLIVSGESPLGGIDIWTHDLAISLGYKFHPYTPEIKSWNPLGYGYKARNLDIAKSNIVFVVVPNKYPVNYNGMRFNFCYHCHSDAHIKSGGCWTAKQALINGNLAEWRIIKQEEL